MTRLQGLQKCCLSLLTASLVFVGDSALQAQKRGGPKVIRLEEIRIEGRVQKPNAFYILNRSSLGDSASEMRTSFLPEIRRSVRRAPF